MLISEYLALRNQISVTTGNTVVQPANGTAKDAVQAVPSQRLYRKS